ncbi:lipocalin family protein [Maridesulfovibrio ferrireducens]|uniref:lipocalin family protein n=1 Tax=Maridesulfovibrio ferrireducens TaxID=246191 RepID=UPI001A334FB0|nr:lipocalin family protein [Maridesulfovibrio ferrireducens]MBI9113205.1 lipocalin family protein [Maridesulfovibrio ferrireducens]
MKTIEYLDVDRFMGDWYIIAIIPNLIEKDAYNGIESYSRGKGNKINITYTFYNRKNGKKRVMHPKGEIYDTATKAEWRVQFIWPLKFPYLLVDIAPDYRYATVGVPNKKYVWIMSRNSQMTEEDYQRALKKLSDLGYDIEKIRKMDQVWE